MSSQEGRVIYEFGDFRLDADQRQLLSKLTGEAIPLVSRAFDTLLYLVQHPSGLVGKAELMQAVWPNTIVEENNLSQSIAAVRRALGERAGEHRYIVTIPGRGFRFVPPVDRHPLPSAPQLAAEPAVYPSQPEASRQRAATQAWASRRWLVAVTAVMAVASAASAYLLRPRLQDQPTVHTLAILPFKAVDPADADKSLRYGMTDTLISRLRGLEGVSVQPFTSVRRFGNPDQDALAAAKTLGVTAVLDGTIQRNGDRLRVTASLIDVASGRHLWSDQFHESFTDIFSVQDAIAAKVTDALAVQLTGTQRRRLTHRYTDDAEAYQLYVNGWFLRTRLEADGYLRSIDFFRRAIARDPKYPLPYVGLADSYAMLAVFGVMAPKEAFPPALAAAQKALELDGELGEAHASLGHIKIQWERDYAAAEREYQHALSIAPRYATAHGWYGLLLAWRGEFDASLEQLREARRLEPLQLGSSATIGMILYFARRYDAAIEELRRVLEAEPRLDHARSFLGRAYLRKGDYDAAIREFQSRKSLSVASYADLASAYALAGRRQEALAELDRLMKLRQERYVSAYDIAVIHVSLRQYDEAFDWLNRAIDERTTTLVILPCDPAVDAIREDARMKLVMTRLNAAPTVALKR